MNLTHHRKSSAVVAGLVIGGALLLAGCATKTAGEIPMEGKIVLVEGQYESAFVTGSRLPVLVPKGQVARAATLAVSPVLSLSPEELQRMRDRADNVGK